MDEYEQVELSRLTQRPQVAFLVCETLRFSPGDRGKHATLRKGGSPMSGESPLALAVCDAPQPHCFVIRPTDELPRIPWVELDAGDTRAAIFSDVRVVVNFSTPLPRAGEA